MNKKIKVTDDILDQQLDILPKEIKFCNQLKSILILLILLLVKPFSR